MGAVKRTHPVAVQCERFGKMVRKFQQRIDATKYVRCNPRLYIGIDLAGEPDRTGIVYDEMHEFEGGQQ